LRFQNVQAGMHAARAAGALGSGMERGAKGNGQRETDRRVMAARSNAMGCSGAVHRLPGKFNDILERSVCGCVVRGMCVCYIRTQNSGVNREILIR
jgi:hypothetical protein